MPTPTVNGQTFAQASQGITDRGQLGALAQSFQAAANGGSSSNSNSGSSSGSSSPTSYTPLATGATPTYGSSGSAVSAYQTQLNAQNAGQAGYIPLVVDGKYGPLTQAASRFGTSNINQPLGSAFNFNSSGTYTLPGYVDPEKSVDQGKIRSDIISQFQDRINSLNNVYNNQLTDARNQAKGNVGSTTAILAARGLTGAPRGQAIAQGTVDMNNKAIQSIDAQRNDAIQAIYQQATELSYQEAERRRNAITSGAKNYIDYLKTQSETKTANLSNVAQQFISQGVDPTTLAPQELQSIAKQLGVTTQDIISSYQQEKYNLVKSTSGKSSGSSSGSSSGLGSSGYTPGANPAADNWVQLITNDPNKYKIANVPANLRNAVVAGLVGGGNGANGGPTQTELGKAALITAKDLLTKFQKGTDAVGINALFNGIALPGTQKSNFIIDFNALKSQLSLDAVKYLKGQGAVSDAERQLLAQATSKLNTRQTKKEFENTLLEIIAKLQGDSPISQSSGDPAYDAYLQSIQ